MAKASTLRETKEMLDNTYIGWQTLTVTEDGPIKGFTERVTIGTPMRVSAGDDVGEIESYNVYYASIDFGNDAILASSKVSFGEAVDELEKEFYRRKRLKRRRMLTTFYAWAAVCVWLATLIAMIYLIIR